MNFSSFGVIFRVAPHSEQLKEVKVKYGWYAVPLMIIELVMIHYLFIYFRTMFWIFIPFYTIFMFAPSYHFKKSSAIKKELIMRDLWE